MCHGWSDTLFSHQAISKHKLKAHGTGTFLFGGKSVQLEYSLSADIVKKKNCMLQHIPSCCLAVTLHHVFILKAAVSLFYLPL